MPVPCKRKIPAATASKSKYRLLLPAFFFRFLTTFTKLASSTFHYQVRFEHNRKREAARHPFSASLPKHKNGAGNRQLRIRMQKAL
jgi:hypothetical protein